MSKSFDFCKAIAQDASRSSYTDRNWDNAIEYNNTEAIFDKYLNKVRSFSINGKLESGINFNFNVNLSFDNNADFDYFTSASCIHDGALVFVENTICRCVKNVCLARTYNKNIGALESGDSVEYVIGNFVVLTEYDGDFVPNDKPWMRERTTVLLSLKFKKVNHGIS